MDYLTDLTKTSYNYYEAINFITNKELSAVTVKNGYILPPILWKYRINNPYNKENSLHGEGGVLDDQLSYVEMSAQKAYGMKNRIYGKYDVSKFNIRYIHDTVIYMNFYIHQWGHYLIDVIGRLWYAANIDKTSKIAYTCYLGKDDVISGNYLELIKLFGIDINRLLCVNQVTRFDSIIVPENSIFPGKYYTKEYKELFDKAVENAHAELKKDNKIYCSRKNVIKANFREQGEDYIQKVFESSRYRSIFLEKLTLSEQIRTLNSASEIVMINGSLAHNLLFLRNNANVTIINKTYRFNLHQFLINQISNANVTFVDAYVAPLPILYGYGPFLIRRTDQFIYYCRNKNINVNEIPKCNQKLSIKDKAEYYIKYIYIYRKFFITFETIKEGNNDIGYIDKKAIRKGYKLSQRNYQYDI